LEGLVMSRTLASMLSLGPGDAVQVEVLEGERRRLSIPVAAVVDDFVGISAYMRLEALHRVVRGPRMVSGAYLQVDDAARPALGERLKELPVVASVASPAD